ncbi:class I SAM-dependent methyltransferase [Prosthecobacter fluviatilis]|uniref:Class I SAM-dependent methyltransferase n=1 Tax=Prosthecobacter fluviatilis TaxID=445931 RepID=A0ABW0KP19_9BACT
MRKLLKSIKAWRKKRRSEAVKSAFGEKLEVLAGPFAGMKYHFESHGSSIVPKLVGVYEEPIAGWVAEIPQKQYDRIVDVGAAEGYYTVGFAYKNMARVVHGFDISEEARKMLERLAALNNVRDKVTVNGLCDAGKLQELAGKGALVFCDAEGAELELLNPAVVPSLLQTDMIVETHDFLKPGITNTLIERFRLTHRIEVMSDSERQWAKYSWPAMFNDRMKRGWSNEGRPKGMLWLRMLAIHSA